MGEAFVDGPPDRAEPAEERLDSWKEIAAYLQRDVTTVQRWEKRERMPVHRHVHEKLGTVYAFKSDLAAWSRDRAARADEPPRSESIPVAAAPSVELPATSPSPAPETARRHIRWLPLLAAATTATLAGMVWYLRTEHASQHPVGTGRVEHLVDFDGTETAAAVSRDGSFVAFLSDRDGRMDVWLTHVGNRQFYNLTKGGFEELANPSVRTLGFSPDGSLVTFWTRKHAGSRSSDIDIWAVPILGGTPTPYLEGVAELGWSNDGRRLVYHTPGPGDPTYIREPGLRGESRKIFTAPAGFHAHFPLWAPDDAFIYFVQGSVPHAMDIWRMAPSGGVPERITQHNARVSHPVFVDRHTLMYLASDPDGSGPWLYNVDVDRRIPRRISSGIERYTSLAASANGDRLVATLAAPKETLWRAPIADTPAKAATLERIALATGRGYLPRLGPGYLLYVTSNDTSASIWKLAGGRTAALWSAPGGRIVGGPSVSPDGRRIAFSIAQGRQTGLYVSDADGTHVRLVTESLKLQGAVDWAPDGKSIASAADFGNGPRLVRIPLDGQPAVRLVEEYSTDPTWDPEARFLVFSGPDIGTTFPLRSMVVAPDAHSLPQVTLTRGAGRVRFLPGRRALVVLRGDIQHKNVWLIELDTGEERALTDLDRDFEIRDFDVSPDGKEIVLERVQELSDVVMIDVSER